MLRRGGGGIVVAMTETSRRLHRMPLLDPRPLLFHTWRAGIADVYATIEHADEAVLERLVGVLELRAADVQQRAMLEDYLADLMLPDESRLLEIGCGPGPIARPLAARQGVGEVVGIDPSPLFVERARSRAADIANLTFVCGDGRDMPFDD